MTSKSIVSLPHKECCGCKACGDVCPKSAITFVSDNEGFFYPNVNADCVDCGLCARVCPAKNSIKVSDTTQTFVGCLDKDLRRRDQGSSGGVFGLLASFLISENYEICGAAFDENLQLRHRFADSEGGVMGLKKSKYLQSDCHGVYKQIKQKIKDGKQVMFIGTPCQCAALTSYLGELAAKTIIVDFACHGVPSQDLFDKCVAYYEQEHHCKVKSYSFRYKPKRYGSPQNFLLHIQSETQIVPIAGKFYEEPFYCGFQKYITLRPSCYQCKWARTERVSDITFADFWGIEEATSKWDRTEHPSLVILNTEKGRTLFEKIKPEMDYFETTKENAVRRNGSLMSPTNMPKERATFFADLQVLPFSDVVSKHLTVRRAWMKDVYYALPFSLRKILLNILSRSVS